MKRGRKPKNFGRKSGPNMKRGRKPKNFERKAEENISYDIPEKIIEKMDLMQNFNQILYRVRWPNTWEPEHHLLGCIALDRFLDVDIDEVRVNLLQNRKTDVEEWEVHKILELRTNNIGKMEYLVEWKDTWVKGANFQWPQLLREFQQQHQHLHSNDDHKETQATGSNNKRKRLNETDDENKACTSTNTPDTTKNVTQNNTDEGDFYVHIDDNQIVRIVKLGTYCNEKMFLFERLNGEYALIPTKVANIKYPDAVMDFYEQFILPEL